MLKKLLILFIGAPIIVGCVHSKNFQEPGAPKQGVTGIITEVYGNQMPSPGMPLPQPRPIKTTVYIYTLTHISETRQQGLEPFFSKINTRFIDSVVTDTGGYFRKELPVGKYSLFLKVNGLFFANSYDIENNIQPVEIEARKWTEVKISLNHKAVY